MEKQRKIGIFDSGIGGVTVLKEIIKLLPNERYYYYSDSKNNPYGDKTKEEINQICEENLKYLIRKGCTSIVIACNTASAVSAEFLRKKYPSIAIIAIEPAYKMIYDYAYDKETLVMATKGTIESEKFHLLYDKYNNHRTTLLPCIGLADKIENGNIDQIKECLKKELKEYKGKVQNVVLGCTHYPLVQKEISEILGNVKFFNGAKGLAIHLKEILEKEEKEQEKYNTNKIYMDKSSNENIRKEKNREMNKKINNNYNDNIEFEDSSKDNYKRERFFKQLEKNIDMSFV